MRFSPFLIITIIVFFVDAYILYHLKQHIVDQSEYKRKVIFGYIVISSITYIAIASMFFLGNKNWIGWSKNILLGTAQAIFIAKLFMVPFLFLADIIHLFSWLLYKNNAETPSIQNGMSRLTFFYKAALLVGGTTFAGFLYGVYKGAYNIKTNYIKIKKNNLPQIFKQLKIVQISDLHVGSFPNANHLENMVKKINQEEADFVFFTGDLVNYRASEVEPYLEILSKIKAKRQVYSILGNHDYGTYYEWNSKEEERANVETLIKYQKQLGWKILMDEHEIINYGAHNLAIIGIQYWGHSLRFGQIGNLNKAYQGAEHADLQLLLSHDPSHFDYEVSKNEKYKNIDATFAGHTHGFQFGVEIPKLNFQWSPSQYVYPHWGGLYQNKNQYLYVNRGMGYIGYPGRLGIPPEISVFSFE